MPDEKLNSLIAAQHTFIFRIARRTVFDDEKCLDITQETIFKGIKYSYQFRDEPVAYKVRNWLSRIMTNCINDMLRNKKRKPVDMEVKEYHLILDNPSDKHFEKEDLYKAITKLSAKQSEVILYLLSGYSYNEMMAILDITLEAVKSRIFYAKISLKKEMTALGYDKIYRPANKRKLTKKRRRRASVSEIKNQPL